MNIHEYQAKQILGRFGVPVPKGQFATTPEEAAAAFTALADSYSVWGFYGGISSWEAYARARAAASCGTRAE